MIISAIVSNVIIQAEAALEAKYGDKHGAFSKFRDWISMLTVQAIGMANGHMYGWLIYIGYRMVLFDYSYIFWYGKLREKKLAWSYVGGSSLWDRMLRKINPYLVLSIRAVILLYLITHI